MAAQAHDIEMLVDPTTPISSLEFSRVIRLVQPGVQFLRGIRVLAEM